MFVPASVLFVKLVHLSLEFAVLLPQLSDLLLLLLDLLLPAVDLPFVQLCTEVLLNSDKVG